MKLERKFTFLKNSIFRKMSLPLNYSTSTEFTHYNKNKKFLSLNCQFKQTFFILDFLLFLVKNSFSKKETEKTHCAITAFTLT